MVGSWETTVIVTACKKKLTLIHVVDMAENRSFAESVKKLKTELEEAEEQHASCVKSIEAMKKLSAYTKREVDKVQKQLERLQSVPVKGCCLYTFAINASWDTVVCRERGYPLCDNWSECWYVGNMDRVREYKYSNRL